MKQFKTESKRILDLMINSIYTNREIFLREIVSNASDAIDKLHFLSLTDSKADKDFAITLAPDKGARTLTIADNGVGMSREELEKNLGTIAESGTFRFKKDNEAEKNELIGQFGVGFYSAFMVAKKVEVLSRAYGEERAHLWISEGSEGYSIAEAERENSGTTITLHLKDKDEDCDYAKYLEEYELVSLVKKYSDYIRYPIRMERAKSRKKEDGDEYESYKEWDTLNSMVPIWRQNKRSVKKEQYDEFYSAKFHDYTPPLKVIHAGIEGTLNFSLLLFIPAKAPYDYFSKDYQKGLQLYSNGVLIMDKCADLLPDYFGFMRGVVDCGDISLNISREMLQQDRQLRSLAQGVEKRILSELKKLLDKDRETYDKMFAEFGVTLKFGIYNNYGMKKDDLKDLVLFYSSTEKKPVTLKEYVSRIREGQDSIYYACGENAQQIDRNPKTELLKEKGFEILYLTDNVDEFVLKVLDSYQDKKFKSADAKDLGLETEEEKDQAKKEAEDNKPLFDFMKESLSGAVKEVRLSNRLKSNAFCLTADGEVSLEMEKVFKQMQGKNGMPVEAEKALELNPAHPLFEKLKRLFETDKDTVSKYAKILYNQSLVTEGFPVEDPGEFAALVTEVLSN
ncbi:MAG: molecular chaperone HtpG [Clostridiales bacterium]|jgi:molecular chaperone HtpG|nr:molecular chaperone HtpG [Clostridiales bacterium]